MLLLNRYVVYLWASLMLASQSAFAGGAGLTYHGRILKPDGVPVTSASVQFRIQIRTPGSENCLMYEETQVKNLSATSGVFSLTINDGTATTPNTEPFTLSDIFKNSGSFSFMAGKCSGGSTYAPNPSDGRKLLVSFNDGSGWETLPAQEINFVPLALESESVGGKTSSSFLRVNSAAESSNTQELTTTDLTNFWDLINGSSNQYLKTSLSGATLPSFFTNPSSPSTGSIWYDSTDNRVKFYDGSSVQTVGTSGGSVTGVTIGPGLVDGDGNTNTTITTSGKVQLPDVGTPDTYYKVTTDAKGRVTSGSTSLSESDLPAITTVGKVSGGAITSGTIGGSTAIDTSGDITTSGDLTAHSITASGNITNNGDGSTTGVIYSTSLQTRRLHLYDDGTNHVTVKTPATLTHNYTLTLPSDKGAAGDVLATDVSGNLSWISPATGSVTSISGAPPLTVDSSTAATPSISLSQASATTDGYLSSSDWTMFNNKLDGVGGKASLTDGNVWIGDGGNKAQAHAVSGDISLTNTGVVSVTKIKGYGLDFSTAPIAGQFLKYNGSNWTAAVITESSINGLSTDLADKISISQMPANCTSGQTLTFSSPTGTWACSGITVSGLNFSSQAANIVFASPNGSSGTPTFRALTANDLPPGTATQWNNGTAGAIYYNGGSVGIGTTSPSEKLEVAGKVKATALCIGSDCKSAWPPTNDGTVTSVSGTSPIHVAIGTSTPVISVDAASTTSKGVVTLATDGETTAGEVVQANDSRLSSISEKVDNTLGNGKVFIGNASNKATAQWFGVQNLRTSTGAQQFSDANCAASQTMTWSSLTDAFSCTDISIASSQVSGLTASNVTNTASGTIAATNVQAAINELGSEKVAKSGDTMTGLLTVPLLRRTPAALPGSPVAGDIAVDSGDGNKLKWYNGSNWQSPSGENWTFSAKSSDFSVTSSDSHKIFQVSGNTNVTLPAANSVSSGFILKVRNSGNGRVKIKPSGSETIGEALFASLDSKNAIATVMSDGANWYPFSYSGDVGLPIDGDAKTFSALALASNQFFVVPAGWTSITVKAWGAGGGSGYNGGAGGAGGAVVTTLSVTPGEVLIVRVGTGGGAGVSTEAVPAGGWPGGGAGSSAAHSGEGGGAGGGYTALLRNNTVLALAAGGGGGSGFVDIGAGLLYGGGAGGTSGASGEGYAGGGATVSTAGTACTSGTVDGNAGDSLLGADANASAGSARPGGGGGGAGYFGGGSGCSGDSSETAGGGGGGSNYPGSGTSYSGSGTVPGNNSDSDYVAGIGVGGSSGDGGNGMLVIQFNE